MLKLLLCKKDAVGEIFSEKGSEKIDFNQKVNADIII